MKWFGISLVLLVIDQLTKVLANIFLAEESIAVLPFVALHLICNTGAAFGILGDQRIFLSIVGVVFVVYFSWHIHKEQQQPDSLDLQLCAYALILAGAAGNLIDRLWGGCVTDFVLLHYGRWHFPIFNVADTCISFGATLWIITLVFGNKLRPPDTASSSEPNLTRQEQIPPATEAGPSPDRGD